MIEGKARCGLRYAVKRSGSAVGYCSLSIKCGTRDEGGFPEGIAHFTEHTIFKGTSRRSASTINSYLDKLGGELNAYTTKEEIVIHSTVLKEDIGKALGLLMDLATAPTFPDNEIETEKGVVTDEINSYKDSPADEIYDRFEEMLFGSHPLGRRILGKCSTVKKITGDDLRRFTSERFLPSRMAVAVVADIDEKRMEGLLVKLISLYFGEESHEPDSPVSASPSPIPSLFDRTLEKRNHEANAVIGSTAPSLYDGAARYSASLLANILGGPASNSLLNAELREKHGWVYNVETSYTPFSDTGVFAINLGCDRANLDKCFKTISKVVTRLQDSPMSEQKVKAARKQFLGQLAISSDNGETQCLSMGKSLLAYGHISSDEEIRERIASISPSDIMASAADILAPGRVSRLIFL